MARKPSARVLATILILFSGSLAGGGTFAQTNLTTEPNTNRPGHDYQSFNLDRPDPGLCRNRCAQDRRCQAYTYVNPGVQGPRARCWLKSVAPMKQSHSCCVSGVKKQFFIPRLKLTKILPGGAALFRCSGGGCPVSNAADVEVRPEAANQTVYLDWNVTQIPDAGGVLWQVSRRPFPPFAGGAGSDRNPDGLALSGHGAGKRSGFAIDFRRIAPDSRVATGTTIFHVRVLPVAPGGSNRIVGQPSNVMRVHYGRAPGQEPFRFFDRTVKDPAPRVRLTRFEYRPYNYTRKWPPGCREVERDKGRRGINALVHFVNNAWSAVSNTYKAARGAVVDVVSRATFGVVPKQILDGALQAALVSAGIPPDIPNLDQLMDQGTGYLAQVVANQVVGPLGDQATAALAQQMLGGSPSVWQSMARDELRQRVRDELERKTYQGIRNGAQAARNELRNRSKSPYCHGKTDWPTVLLTVMNVGDRDYRDVSLSLGDSGRVFENMFVNITLRRGQTMTIPLGLKPRLRVVSRTQSVSHDESVNWSHWWNEYYFKTASSMGVGATGRTTCLGGNCATEQQALYGSPTRLWTTAFVR